MRAFSAALLGAAVLTPLAASAPASIVPKEIAWGHSPSIAVSASGGISLIDPTSGATRRLTKIGTTGGTLDWSPDGRALLISNSDSKLYVIRSDGTGLHSLGVGIYGRWSPNGKRIGFFRSQGLFVMNADGSGARLLAQNRYLDFAGPPAWSPDSRRLAYIACSAAFLSQPCEHQYGFDIYTISANGTGKHRVTKKSGLPQCPAWSSAGKLAFYTGEFIAIVQADGSVRTFRVSRGCPAWAPGGHRLSVFGSSGPILLNADGSGRHELHVLKKPSPSTGKTAWSPDGRRIAFLTELGGGSSRLYVVGADGRGLKQLLP